jgi:hypothetical protein
MQASRLDKQEGEAKCWAKEKDARLRQDKYCWRCMANIVVACEDPFKLWQKWCESCLKLKHKNLTRGVALPTAMSLASKSKILIKECFVAKTMHSKGPLFDISPYISWESISAVLKKVVSFKYTSAIQLHFIGPQPLLGKHDYGWRWTICVASLFP